MRMSVRDIKKTREMEHDVEEIYDKIRKILQIFHIEHIMRLGNIHDDSDININAHR